MIYVRRDPQGHILSLHRNREAGAEEAIARHAPEVQDFLADLGQAANDAANDLDQGTANDGAGLANNGLHAFSRLDADFIRVLEDLIDVLITRRVLTVTDLPSHAQLKLRSRKGYRADSLADLNLLGTAVNGQIFDPVAFPVRAGSASPADTTAASDAD